jgi:hypothetical protein
MFHEGSKELMFCGCEITELDESKKSVTFAGQGVGPDKNITIGIVTI